MHADRTEPLADASQAAAEFEGEIRELIRSRDVTFLRNSTTKGVGDVSNLNSLIQRVAGTSTHEIDALIEQLQDMREFLQNEGERISREIAGYAQVSQKARSQLETLTERVSEWRSAVQAPPLTHD